MILETDGNVIASKVATSSVDPAAPLSEQVMFLSFVFFDRSDVIIFLVLFVTDRL